MYGFYYVNFGDDQIVLWYMFLIADFIFFPNSFYVNNYFTYFIADNIFYIVFAFFISNCFQAYAAVNFRKEVKLKWMWSYFISGGAQMKEM